ncbi:MAG TPA: hypothetical protein DIC60_04710 [Lachnospiraceae bacterium]|nr:hypothetical protein [Lachnospiraceae bacterium]
MNVPPGFVIFSTTFDEFILQNNLKDTIDGVLIKIDYEESISIDHASIKIRELIMNYEISNEIKNEIINQYNQLNTNFVAVRSSATAEDGETSTWAGQLETYLNTTEKELITNIQKCWTSLFTPRAIFYRSKKGFDKDDAFLDEELKRKLKAELNITDNEVTEVFSRIATCPPLGELAYSEEPIDLFKIAKSVKDNIENIDNISEATNEMLNRHVQKYSWLKCPVAFEDGCFTKEDYIERLKFLIEDDIDGKIDRAMNTRSKNEKEYLETVVRYQIKGSLLKLCEATRNFIFLRTYTTEASDDLFYTGKHTILKEVAKRIGITLNEIVMLTPDDIIRKLKGSNIDLKEVIFKRQQGLVIIWVNGEITTIFGEQALEIQSEINKAYRLAGQIDDNKSENVVAGMPANPGKARGTVKILNSFEDNQKVKKGDIIVASMTTPDYISAMEKAAAFVTDEGGITCHAAIVSREFDVPCIVGTVNATQMLRDGQMVEVDADRGVVVVL